MLYHVSNIGGIKVLEPKVSSHGKAYVYAIENRVTGLLFGARWDDFDFILDANDSGTPEIYECFPDAFDRIYRGRRCYVYELTEGGFMRGMTGWSPELVSENAVRVISETVVEDLYSALSDASDAGELILHRYERSPEYKKMVSEHIVDRLIRFDALDKNDERFEKYYKNIIDALKNITDGNLL